MTRAKGQQGGFTLIELVMVIVILGILSAVAIPQFFDLQSDANDAAESGVVGGVRGGIYTYFAKNRVYPSTLDAATSGVACTSANACFTEVIDQGGVISDWDKTGALTYLGPGGTTYTYTTNGQFK